MTSCLSGGGGGGGRTYGFDFEFMKSPSTSTITSPTSSPSSTISESSNSPRAITTRKPRTPRKRPNQTYNEAATLLSTAYPNLFSTKNLKKPGKFTKPTETFWNESSELLLPFRVFDSSSFLLHQPIQHKPSFPFPKEPKVVIAQEKACQSPVQITSREMDHDADCQQEDFDCESILDEEIEEGIDSIMGSSAEDSKSNAACYQNFNDLPNPWKTGNSLDFRALRRVDHREWWNFPAVDILQISPRMNMPTVEASVPATVKKMKKKKKKKVEKPTVELKNSELAKENSISKLNMGLLLKLNYDEVSNAWSDRGSPFADDCSGSGVPGNDVTARLAHIDLFSENGGLREASVLRYKEKRRTRLFSKKIIRYQVRKVNADQRPRMKGRFVTRANAKRRI